MQSALCRRPPGRQARPSTWERRCHPASRATRIGRPFFCGSKLICRNGRGCCRVAALLVRRWNCLRPVKWACASTASTRALDRSGQYQTTIAGMASHFNRGFHTVVKCGQTFRPCLSFCAMRTPLITYLKATSSRKPSYRSKSIRVEDRKCNRASTARDGSACRLLSVVCSCNWTSCYRRHISNASDDQIPELRSEAQTVQTRVAQNHCKPSIRLQGTHIARTSSERSNCLHKRSQCLVEI